MNMGWHYSSGYPNAISLSADKNIKLHAVRVFGSENSEYSIRLTVADSNRIVIADVAGNFLSEFVLSEIGNYQRFEIAFKALIALQGNKVYHFTAKISGPPSWFGERGQYSVLKAFWGDIQLLSLCVANHCGRGSVSRIYVYSGLGTAH